MWRQVVVMIENKRLSASTIGIFCVARVVFAVTAARKAFFKNQLSQSSLCRAHGTGVRACSALIWRVINVRCVDYTCAFCNLQKLVVSAQYEKQCVC